MLFRRFREGEGSEELFFRGRAKVKFKVTPITVGENTYPGAGCLCSLKSTAKKFL